MKQVSLQLTSDILSALAHPNRINILEFLRAGPRCACEIIPSLEMEQSNLSRHMKILVQAGIVNNWKEGQKVMYEIIDSRYYQIIDTIVDMLRERTKETIKALEEAG